MVFTRRRTIWAVLQKVDHVKFNVAMVAYGGLECAKEGMHKWTEDLEHIRREVRTF